MSLQHSGQLQSRSSALHHALNNCFLLDFPFFFMATSSHFWLHQTLLYFVSTLNSSCSFHMQLKSNDLCFTSCFSQIRSTTCGMWHKTMPLNLSHNSRLTLAEQFSTTYPLVSGRRWLAFGGDFLQENMTILILSWIDTLKMNHTDSILHRLFRHIISGQMMKSIYNLTKISLILFMVFPKTVGHLHRTLFPLAMLFQVHTCPPTQLTPFSPPSSKIDLLHQCTRLF